MKSIFNVFCYILSLFAIIACSDMGDNFSNNYRIQFKSK